jgi:hypothetical protein
MRAVKLRGKGWLKILANSIYGFFVELIAEHYKQPKDVMVFSGDDSFPDCSTVIEKRGTARQGKSR